MRPVKLFILLTVVISVVPLSSFAESKECLLSPTDLAGMLKLDYKSFDQTLPNGGWRGLANKGCELEATKLVEIYHLHHYEDLSPWQARILYWHAGQVYAMQGLTDLALARFKKSYDTEEKADNKFKWNAYVRGSIAFLEHNMSALTKARDELRLADKMEPNPNLKLLDAFVRCFNKTYKEAYNPDCKP